MTRPPGPSTGGPGTPTPTTQAQNDPHDIAVVVLDRPVAGIVPARLPAAGSMDSLRVGTRFTSVGYGAQSVTIDHGPTFHYADVRYVATGGLLAVNPSWLRISMNPARGNAALLRRLRGPNFLGAGGSETNVVAAITITGDAMCRATNVTYRLDTPSTGVPRPVRHPPVGMRFTYAS